MFITFFNQEQSPTIFLKIFYNNTDILKGLDQFFFFFFRLSHNLDLYDCVLMIWIGLNIFS